MGFYVGCVVSFVNFLNGRAGRRKCERGRRRRGEAGNRGHGDSLAKEIGVSTPAPFSDSWEDDAPLDLALKLLNGTYRLLRLTPNDQTLGVRLLTVSRFCMVTEDLYGVSLRRALTSANYESAHPS